MGRYLTFCYAVSPSIARVKRLPATAVAPAGIIRTNHKGTAPGTVVKVAVSPAAQTPVKAAAGIVKYDVPLFGLAGEKSVSILPVPNEPERTPSTVYAVAVVKVIVHWSYTVPRLPSTKAPEVKSPVPTVATFKPVSEGARDAPAAITLATRVSVA